MPEAILRVRNLTKRYGTIAAVDDASFDLGRGEVLAIVGESGCGKTTLLRAIDRLTDFQGLIELEGRDISRMEGRALRRMRRSMQMIFQSPSSALDPRMKAGDIIAEPLRIHGRIERTMLKEEVGKAADAVGIDRKDLGLTPDRFSLGQKQRIAIARAIISKPSVILADEPVSSLDAPLRRGVLDLIGNLRKEMGISFIIVSHDLEMVRSISDHVIVMNLGRIVEEAETDELYSNPLHPFTKALLDAASLPDPIDEIGRIRPSLPGEPVRPEPTFSGCPFQPRCRESMAKCISIRPGLDEAAAGHLVSCLLHQRKER